ncbi:hypothetical protein EOA32_21380 [Mesorhizobium sp. M1A.F.Ca.ET.072.01.1.1]|uniref:hypothetical protein n=1 Tax=Mesorhizobium sp. M1A.F.Ca.ET.072.01.1.1 TaxID=2496753 RepID=UPI000FD597C4|nr:hypothetical protein [Mesorhizobium sp. M1A.F.Ca.ET.072.01.1.1]RUW49786.1 hypothetical protein EOA32_21380 [Mesorhizobium sp. M1A.F.Ca.ET.072.01.1.1]TIV02918.1 MAG: hypothetical protein E5W04_10985 [Mesorhizobium sp.]
MPLISLDNGDTLNSQQVVKMLECHDGRHQFGMSDGSLHAGFVDEPERAFFPIVPAVPGFKTIATDIFNGVRRWDIRSVVAWQICPGGNFALAAGPSNEEGYAALIEPDGAVVDCDGDRFDSLEAFQQSVEEADAAHRKAA